MPPPNTPEEGSLSTAVAVRPQFVQSDLTPEAIDIRSLEYESEIDENLICPICRVPLISPVITNCDHVFCQKCITEAHSLNPVCPVDRQPLRLPDEIRTAPKIIHNQLDNLVVRCPNRARGCNLVVARSLVENHVTRYCEKTLVRCPHPSCGRLMVRKDADKGCLHYDVKCEYCETVYEKAELEEHQDNECPNRKTQCELCEAEYVRHRQEEHAQECPEAEVFCQFASLGCAHVTKRKELEEHYQRCEYRVVGPVGEQLAELRAEVLVLREKDQLKERRIKFLENRGFSSMPTATSDSTMAVMGLPDAPAPAPDPAPYESRDQYFLSLFETLEAKLERLSSALSEVEGRHSVMLFNETLSTNEQLTEIRSTLGVLGMHVRWLMNFRLQERGRVGTASSPNMAGTMDGGSHNNNSEPNQPRRLSDALRENPPRL